MASVTAAVVPNCAEFRAYATQEVPYALAVVRSICPVGRALLRSTLKPKQALEEVVLKRHPVPRSPFMLAPVRRLWALVGTLFLTALVACGSATGDGDGSALPVDPLASKPPISAVQDAGQGFSIEYIDDTWVGDPWWSLDILYDSNDEEAVFSHYQALFAAPDYTVISEVSRVGEMSAAYLHGASGAGVLVRAKRDGNRVRVDLDFERLGRFDPPVPAGFSLTRFQEIEVTFVEGAEVIDLEWAFSFSHGGRGVERVFPAYDAQLLAMGWTPADLDDGEDAEWESEYVLDGVYLELKAGGDTWVEMEVNKLRFYQD